MKLQKLLHRKWNYTALAFAIPFIGILMVMLVSQYTPFGKYSMLYSDMYHQYYPFFHAFRSAILSGESLLHYWDIGMGIDYLGLISYYLASPLNLLSVLVPESLTLEYFSLLMPLKLGLAGLFFAIFLKKMFRRDDFSISLFGAFYALCAWALGYQWNIMWLDTFALLPLVALGTVALLRDKKFVLYTITLFLSIFSNYYIGLFTCIFVLLLFICYQICRWQGFKRFFLDLCRIAFFSILAIGMTAILELPALAALQTTQSSVNKFPQGFKLNITDDDSWKGLLDAMRQVAGNMNGGLNYTFKEGLPNLYCGMGTIVFSFLFLTCRQVKLRDKLCCVFLLLFFNVSFIIRQLDYIWHGFHFTNMIPYRFSFLYSFVMLYMAYRSYLLRRRFKLWQLITAGVLAVGILFCAEDWTDIVFWVYSSVFLLLYLGCLLYPYLLKKPGQDAAREQIKEFLEIRRDRRSFSATVLFIVMAMEIVLNLVNFGVTFGGTSVSNYPKGTEDSEAILEYMKDRDQDPFYRTEVTHAQTLNDGALNGYYGISTFTSSANVRVTEFMKALGYGAKNTYNRYCFEESSPVANLFLGLKYMIHRDGEPAENSYFDVVHNSGDIYLMENNTYLPLGFLANSQLAETSFDVTDKFTLQNNLLRDAAGLETDVWHMLVGSCLSITSDNVELTSTNDTGYCSYAVSEDSAGTVTYTYTADRAGFVCFSLEQSKKNKITVSKNGGELYSETYSLPQTLAVCDVAAGDTVQITLKCTKGEKGTITIHTAILDESRFRKAYDVLATSTLELTSFHSTLIEGTINCDRDGLLYTSIPQNGNWYAVVDGQPAEIKLVGDAMVAVEMTEGYHTVQFIYKNAAFELGWKISLGCLATFLAAYLLVYQPNFSRKKGKYEK